MRMLQGGCIGQRALRIFQWTSLSVGALLCSLYAVAVAEGELGRRADVAKLLQAIRRPDQSLWSRSRVRAFDTSRREVADEPIALLRVPSLWLVVPLYATASELHLNRGAGLIERMSRPGAGGNLGIAGHRDGYFRALKNIAVGAVIEVQTLERLHRYRVTSIEIVDATDRHLLAQTREPTITLVTCYPFYYVGPAPRRFIVRGVPVLQ